GLEHERHHGLNLARLGVLHAELGDSARAAANLRRAMELEPRDYRFAVALGDLLEREGDAAGAIEAYAESLFADVEIVDSAFWDATEFRRAFRPAVLRRAWEIAGRASEEGAAYRRGKLALDGRDYDSAVTLLQAVGPLYVAEALLSAGRLDEAEGLFTQVLEQRPQDVAYIGRARIHLARGELDRAEQDLVKALAIRQDTVFGQPMWQAHFYLGQVYERRGDPRAAEQLAKVTLPERPLEDFELGYDLSVWLHAPLFVPELALLERFAIKTTTPLWVQARAAKARAVSQLRPAASPSPQATPPQ
ncbi:MAG: tetratricopeptide repeat protein, partial [Chloroflexi bacterium]|nr:tetratricopeptide repeat protein [Chloroflexota bacterium]